MYKLNKMRVRVCGAYSIWKQIETNGITLSPLSCSLPLSLYSIFISHRSIVQHWLLCELFSNPIKDVVTKVKTKVEMNRFGLLLFCSFVVFVSCYLESWFFGNLNMKCRKFCTQKQENNQTFLCSIKRLGVIARLTFVFLSNKFWWMNLMTTVQKPPIQINTYQRHQLIKSTNTKFVCMHQHFCYVLIRAMWFLLIFVVVHL